MNKPTILILWGCLLTGVVGAPVVGAQSDFIYDDHGKRDPFQPLVSSSGAIINISGDIQITDMELEGIIVDSRGDNVAIVNGTIMKKRDTIGGYTVSGISADTVTLQKGNETFVLKLKKEDPK